MRRTQRQQKNRKRGSCCIHNCVASGGARNRSRVRVRRCENRRRIIYSTKKLGNFRIYRNRRRTTPRAELLTRRGSISSPPACGFRPAYKCIRNTYSRAREQRRFGEGGQTSRDGRCAEQGGERKTEGEGRVIHTIMSSGARNRSGACACAVFENRRSATVGIGGGDGHVTVSSYCCYYIVAPLRRHSTRVVHVTIRRIRECTYVRYCLRRAKSVKY